MWQWNGCHLGAAGVLRGMLRRCCGGVIATALLLYLAGQLLPSFLSNTCAEQRPCNHACYGYVVVCYTNAELILDFNSSLWTVPKLQPCAWQFPIGFGLVCCCCCCSPFLLSLLLSVGLAPSHHNYYLMGEHDPKTSPSSRHGPCSPLLAGKRTQFGSTAARATTHKAL